MNNFDKHEYESTLEPMRKRLDWVMFFYFVVWALVVLAVVLAKI